jgi:hypothetical protein
MKEAEPASGTPCVFKMLKLIHEGKCQRICISLMPYLRQELLDDPQIALKVSFSTSVPSSGQTRPTLE